MSNNYNLMIVLDTSGKLDSVLFFCSFGEFVSGTQSEEVFFVEQLGRIREFVDHNLLGSTRIGMLHFGMIYREIFPLITADSTETKEESLDIITNLEPLGSFTFISDALR